MGKVEIKIRKKILTPDNLQQYRNYPALLKKYERTKRFRRALKIFLYSLALTFFVLALIFLGIWKVLLDKKQENSSTYKYVQTIDNKQDTIEVKIMNEHKNDSIHSIIVNTKFENMTDHLQFPLNKSFNKWSDEKLLNEKICLVNNHRIKVLKYNRKFDNVNSFFYYSPDFGVIIYFYAASAHLAHSKWEQKLIKTGNLEKDKFLPELIYCIESDSSFFKHNF